MHVSRDQSLLSFFHVFTFVWRVKGRGCERVFHTQCPCIANYQIRLPLQTKNLSAEDVEGQTEQVMKNLGAVLEAAGSSFSQVVKTTVLLTDMADFGAVNAIYGERSLYTGPVRRLQIFTHPGE